MHAIPNYSFEGIKGNSLFSTITLKLILVKYNFVNKSIKYVVLRIIVLLKCLNGKIKSINLTDLDLILRVVIIFWKKA